MSILQHALTILWMSKAFPVQGPPSSHYFVSFLLVMQLRCDWIQTEFLSCCCCCCSSLSLSLFLLSLSLCSFSLSFSLFSSLSDGLGRPRKKNRTATTNDPSGRRCSRPMPWTAWHRRERSASWRHRCDHVARASGRGLRFGGFTCRDVARHFQVSTTYGNIMQQP